MLQLSGRKKARCLQSRFVSNACGSSKHSITQNALSCFTRLVLQLRHVSSGKLLGIYSSIVTHVMLHAGSLHRAPTSTPLALDPSSVSPSEPQASSSPLTSSSATASASQLSTQPTLNTAPSTLMPGPNSSSASGLPAFGLGATQPATSQGNAASAGFAAFGALPGQTAAAGGAAASSSLSGDCNLSSGGSVGKVIAVMLASRSTDACLILDCSACFTS